MAGTTQCVVMLLIYALSDVNFDFYSEICAFLEWLASKTIYDMEVVVQRVVEGGQAGREAPQAAQGCTSSQWPKEPGQWPSITQSLSNKTVLLSTDPFSSSAKITSYGNMQRK